MGRAWLNVQVLASSTIQPASPNRELKAAVEHLELLELKSVNVGRQSRATRVDRELEFEQFPICICGGPDESRAMAKNRMLNDISRVSHCPIALSG